MSVEPHPQRLLTYADAGRVLSRSKRTIATLAASGELVVVGSGRGRLITAESVDAYVERLKLEALGRRPGRPRPTRPMVGVTR